jgi:hypothetical protein
MSKSDSEIRKTCISVKKTGKVQSMKEMPSLLINNKKLKEPENVASVFNNFF